MGAQRRAGLAIRRIFADRLLLRPVALLGCIVAAWQRYGRVAAHAFPAAAERGIVEIGVPRQFDLYTLLIGDAVSALAAPTAIRLCIARVGMGRDYECGAAAIGKSKTALALPSAAIAPV